MQIRQRLFVGTGVVALQLMPLIALAAISSACDIIGLFRTIANWFAIIIGILATVSILYAAFLFLTAGGNEETVSKAKSTLLWGVVGVAVAVLAFNIIPIVQNTLGGQSFSAGACVAGPTR